MDPKRKRLYIILIIACLVLSAGILWWGQRSPAVQPVPQAGRSIPPVAGASGVAAKNPDGTYSAPAVFPLTTNFDSSFFSRLKTLQSYLPPQVQEGDLGREDPFKSY